LEERRRSGVGFISTRTATRKEFMSNQLSRIMAVYAACLALGVQAQTSTDGSTGTSADQSNQPGYHIGRQFGSAGRIVHQEVRASKMIGADVKSGQGQSLGTINDVIFNPASGRIDFAVMSLRPSSGTEANTSTGKLVPVPWMLLRSGPASGSSAQGVTTVATDGQQTFTFSGDSSKLQSAPSFDQNNWPDITQFSWRQSIYAHFGMTPGSATGSATSPGGTESSAGTSSTAPDSNSRSSTPPPPSSNPESKPPQ